MDPILLNMTRRRDSILLGQGCPLVGSNVQEGRYAAGLSVEADQVQVQKDVQFQYLLGGLTAHAIYFSVLL